LCLRQLEISSSNDLATHLVCPVVAVELDRGMARKEQSPLYKRKRQRQTKSTAECKQRQKETVGRVELRPIDFGADP
jgi:hypothetical protein